MTDNKQKDIFPDILEKNIRIILKTSKAYAKTVQDKEDLIRLHNSTPLLPGDISPGCGKVTSSVSGGIIVANILTNRITSLLAHSEI